MSRPRPYHPRSLVLAFSLGSSLFLASHAAAASPENAVEIAFETTSPYYQPQMAVVPTGAPIQWNNNTASPHSVRHDGCLMDEVCAFHSIAVPPDSSFVIAPLPRGRYTYHCELHPIMRGTLVVVDPLAQRDETMPALESTR